MREIRTLRVMWRELETGQRTHFPATAPVPDPTLTPPSRLNCLNGTANVSSFRKALPEFQPRDCLPNSIRSPRPFVLALCTATSALRHGYVESYASFGPWTMWGSEGHRL